VSLCNDHYEVLGLEKTASSADVKKAYFRLARKLHPDKNTAPGSEAAFHDLQAAYDTLYEEDARQQYSHKLEAVARRGGTGDGRQKERALKDSQKQGQQQGFRWKEFFKVLGRVLYRLPLVILMLGLRYGLMLLRLLLVAWRGSSWTDLYYFPFSLSCVIIEIVVVVVVAVVLLAIRLPWTWRYYCAVIYRLCVLAYYQLMALGADHHRQRRRPQGGGVEGGGEEGEWYDESAGGEDGGFHYSQTTDEGEKLEVWEENGRFYCLDPYDNVYDVTEMCKNMLRDQKRGKQRDFAYYIERWPPVPRKAPQTKTKSTARYRPEYDTKASANRGSSGGGSGESGGGGGGGGSAQQGKKRKGKKGRRGRRRV